MVPDIEDVSEITVGRFYMVPTVILNFGPMAMRVCPVVGPLHEDAEFIKFPDRHFHPDRRFTSQAWFDYYASYSTHWNVVYAFEVRGRDTGMLDGGRRKRKCLRTVGSFTAPNGPPQWLTGLEQAYRHEKLRDKMICPHRGISCVGVVAESDGGVVCPGHGLKWNPKDGELISRVGQGFGTGQRELF